MVELWAGTGKDRLGAKQGSGTGGCKHPPKSWDLAFTVRPRIFFFLVWAWEPAVRRTCRERSRILSFFAACDAMWAYMFITNYHTSFHFRWKENLVKHQKVSKHYDHDLVVKRKFGQTSKSLKILWPWSCCEKKIWSNIEKSQNIMTMILLWKENLVKHQKVLKYYDHIVLGQWIVSVVFPCEYR